MNCCITFILNAPLFWKREMPENMVNSNAKILEWQYLHLPLLTQSEIILNT